MKRAIQILILATAAVATLVSCGGGDLASLQDYNVKVYEPQYSEGFEIVGADGKASTIIKVRNPWQGAENVETMLFIARNGESAPKGFVGQVLDTEAKRIVCMSSSYVAMLDAIGEQERVVGVSGIDFISNEYVINNRDKVFDIGYDSEANFELIVALQTDLVLLYGVTGASSIESKLRELGIPYAYIGEYLEEAPLGKSEWIVAIAEIVGQRERGIQHFSAIPERYNALKAEADRATSAKPKVMINTPYADSWVMASASSYVARLIADAGGDYIYKKNTSNSSRPIDMEEAMILTSEADVWINVGSITSLEEMRRQFPKFVSAPCLQQGNVYNCDKRSRKGGGNDYWESGVVNPDLILRDLIKIFHPELLPSEELVYYRQLE